jgi:hypothetical protein
MKRFYYKFANCPEDMIINAIPKALVYAENYGIAKKAIERRMNQMLWGIKITKDVYLSEKNKYPETKILSVI